jgi:putative membrane protein (TIGR04086 family)
MKKGLRLIQGLFLAYIIAGVILLIVSFLLYKLAWGENITQIGIIAAYIISTVAGGFYVGKKVETKRLLFGFVFGALYFAIIAIVSVFMYPGQTIFSGNFITIICMCIGGGILGSILS